MRSIIFIRHDGSSRTVEAPDGTTMMQAALDNGVNEILGDCGGAMACATCHVYLGPEMLELVGPATGDEEAMLEGAIDPQSCSRLSCQIKLAAAMDGLSVTLPKRQI